MAEIVTKKGAIKQLNLFHLTWPIFLEVFLFMLMGIADTFMLSAVSDDAVSGVGAANQYVHIAILILEVVGNGAAIVVAQYLGSKRYLEASKISALAVTLNLTFGINHERYFRCIFKTYDDCDEFTRRCFRACFEVFSHCRRRNFPTSDYQFIVSDYSRTWFYETNDVCVSWYEYFSRSGELCADFREIWFS